MLRDQCAGDDRLARAGWRDEDAELVPGQGVACGLLLRFELSGEAEGVRSSRVAFVAEFQAAAGLFDQCGEPVEQAAGQDQVSGEGLVVAA